MRPPTGCPHCPPGTGTAQERTTRPAWGACVPGPSPRSGCHAHKPAYQWPSGCSARCGCSRPGSSEALVLAGLAKVQGRRGAAMAQTMPFRIGADASCTDGACGQVSRIIVKPAAREVTHLVVGPKRRPGPGRFVPVDLVDATTGQIRVRCTLAEFYTLPPAEEAESVPDLDPGGHPGYGPNRGNMWVWLHAARDPRESGAPQAVTVDSVPTGRGRRTPRPDRLCHRRRDRAGSRARRGTWRPPCNPRAPPGGAPVGPQGSGYPDRRRD